MPTGRVCAGEQANNKQDCQVFKNRLSSKYGSGNVTTYGEGSATATEGNYTGGKSDDVMYWSSHGYQDGSAYKLQGSTHFGVFNAMSSWTSSNALKVLILASCNSMHTSALQVRWANQLRSSNIRVFAGYGNTAPAGSSTDTTIAKRFFNNLDDGLCVWKAWKAGNQASSTAKSSWGVISYGDTDANKTFKMPGWGTNGSATRNTSIYLIKQSGNTLINAIVPGKDLENLPYAIRVDALTVSMKFDATTHAKISREEFMVTADYREESSAIMTEGAFTANVESAINELGIAEIVKDAHIEEAPITMAEVTELEVKDEILIGGDMIYQQQYMGIPLYDNFIRICADSDSIYRVINAWRPVTGVEDLETSSEVDILNAGEALEKADKGSIDSIVEGSYTYVDRGDGVYNLCHQIELMDGHTYLIDVRTGEVK